MYNGWLPGLLYGLHLPVDGFVGKSKKIDNFKICFLDNVKDEFILILMNLFLILSASGSMVFSKQAKHHLCIS